MQNVGTWEGCCPPPVVILSAAKDLHFPLSVRQFAVYILSSRSRTLYVGVTSDLARRLQQHRDGLGGDFTRRYHAARLVYVELTHDARAAIAREKQIKGWRRDRKIDLVNSMNPGWDDLSLSWFGAGSADPSLRSG